MTWKKERKGLLGSPNKMKVEQIKYMDYSIMTYSEILIKPKAFVDISG